MLWEMVIDGVDVPEDSPARDHVAELLGRIAVRDEGSFAQLYDLLSARVFGLILRVLVNRAQCEEVLQEVFLEIWQSAASFAPNKAQGRTWVMTIAHRRAVDRVRDRRSPAPIATSGRGCVNCTARRRRSTSRSSCASRAGAWRGRSMRCPMRSAKR